MKTPLHACAIVNNYIGIEFLLKFLNEHWNKVKNEIRMKKKIDIFSYENNYAISLKKDEWKKYQASFKKKIK